MRKSDMQIIHALSERGHVSPPIVMSCSGKNLIDIKTNAQGGEITIGMDRFAAMQLMTNKAMFVLYVVDIEAFQEERNKDD